MEEYYGLTIGVCFNIFIIGIPFIMSLNGAILNVKEIRRCEAL